MYRESSPPPFKFDSELYIQILNKFFPASDIDWVEVTNYKPGKPWPTNEPSDGMPVSM